MEPPLRKRPFAATLRRPARTSQGLATVFYRFLPVILLTALTLLGGCTQYREVPPQTVEGLSLIHI